MNSNGGQYVDQFKDVCENLRSADEDVWLKIGEEVCRRVVSNKPDLSRQ
jgi:hypothetical protein